jgi:hypothetical protein
MVHLLVLLSEKFIYVTGFLSLNESVFSVKYEMTLKKKITIETSRILRDKQKKYDISTCKR